MSTPLVQLQLSPVFRNLQQRVERLRDDILTDGGEILSREYQLSIRARWYRDGKTAESVKPETIEDGNRKVFRLTPTATSKSGAPYPLFGEYGTGRRGAATGGPAPAGYRYGDKVGMTARRFSRIAVAQAKPQIDDMAQVKLRQFGGRA
jgi:hypothetical protein